MMGLALVVGDEILDELSDLSRIRWEIVDDEGTARNFIDNHTAGRT